VDEVSTSGSADPATPPPVRARRRTRGHLYAHPGEPHSWAARGVALALVAVLLIALAVLVLAVL
jgi:hypothetical protein